MMTGKDTTPNENRLHKIAVEPAEELEKYREVGTRLRMKYMDKNIVRSCKDYCSY